MGARGIKLKLNLFFVCAIVVIISLFSAPLASAQDVYDDPLSSKVIDLGGARYHDAETGETLTSIYEITDDGLKEVSYEEFSAAREKQKKLDKEIASMKTNSIQKSSHDSIINPMAVWSMYYESYNTDPYTGIPYAVSNPLGCPSNNTISCTISHTFSTSQSESFSANVTADISNKIKSGAGFTWTSSASLTTTYNVTVKPGAKGTIMFQPHFKYTYGELKWYNNGYHFSSEWVSGKSPKKLHTGELAGYVYGVVQ